jgi:hypothetical protein
MAQDAPYEADNLNIQLGSDETELNFSWLTTDPTETDLVVNELPCFWPLTKKGSQRQSL